MPGVVMIRMPSQDKSGHVAREMLAELDPLKAIQFARDVLDCAEIALRAVTARD